MIHPCRTLAIRLAILVGLGHPAFPQDPPSDPARPPELVVVLVVDGLSTDQVTSSAEFLAPDGLRRFLERGAWFDEAHYAHLCCFTGPGHATLATGCQPSRHGVIGNAWQDPRTGAAVYCTADSTHRLLGEAGRPTSGTSPKNLRVPTLGDLWLEHEPEARVFAVSIKDRAAILPAGRRGTAYFYSSQSGRFITSSFYREEYPEWWREWHAGAPQNAWFGRIWEPLAEERAYAGVSAVDRGGFPSYAGLATEFPILLGEEEGEPDGRYLAALPATPFGDEYTLAFARELVRAEALGRPETPAALLFVSLSSNDYIRHFYGPASPQAVDHLLRLDRMLAGLFAYLDEQVGEGRYAAVLASDHGFGQPPEGLAGDGSDAARIDPYAMLGKMNAALEERFGEGPYAVSWHSPYVYLNPKLAEREGLDVAEVRAAAAEILRARIGVAQVWTREQMETDELPDSPVAQAARNAWMGSRCGDLVVVQEPNWYLYKRPQAYIGVHGSPYRYDTHVPLAFYGPWFRAGRYGDRVQPADCAPTLAALLGVSMPAADGHVLREALVAPAADRAPASSH